MSESSEAFKGHTHDDPAGSFSLFVNNEDSHIKFVWGLYVCMTRGELEGCADGPTA